MGKREEKKCNWGEIFSGKYLCLDSISSLGDGGRGEWLNIYSRRAPLSFREEPKTDWIPQFLIYFNLLFFGNFALLSVSQLGIDGIFEIERAKANKQNAELRRRVEDLDSLGNGSASNGFWGCKMKTFSAIKSFVIQLINFFHSSERLCWHFHHFNDPLGRNMKSIYTKNPSSELDFRNQTSFAWKKSSQERSTLHHFQFPIRLALVALPNAKATIKNFQLHIFIRFLLDSFPFISFAFS